MAMSKQEILEAINSTIVANGQKGITAESLNLILNEMVESSGAGGSGEGAIRVHAVPAYVLDMFQISELTPESWEETAIGFNSMLPGFTESVLYLSIKDMFTKNVEVYKTLIEKANSISGTSVILDTSAVSAAYLEFMGAMYELELGGAVIDMARCSASCPVEVNIDNSSFTDLGISAGLGMDPLVQLIGTVKGSSILEDGNIATLLPNGGFTYSKSASDSTYIVYIPASVDDTLTAEYKSKNAELVLTIYDSIINAAPGTKLFNPNNIIVQPTNSEGSTYVAAIRALALDLTNNSFVVTFMDNGILQRVQINSDGNVKFRPVGGTITFYHYNGVDYSLNKYPYTICKYIFTNYFNSYDTFGHGFPSIQIYDNTEAVMMNAINTYYNGDTSSIVVEVLDTSDGSISIKKYTINATGAISND